MNDLLFSDMFSVSRVSAAQMLAEDSRRVANASAARRVTIRWAESNGADPAQLLDMLGLDR
jgi:hypothetical protein